MSSAAAGLAKVEGCFSRVGVGSAQLDQRITDAPMVTPALQRVHAGIDRLAHDFVAEIEPFIRAFDEELALQQHSRASSGSFSAASSSRSKLKSRPMTAPSRNTLPAGVRQAFDSFENDLVDTLVAVQGKYLADTGFDQMLDLRRSDRGARAPQLDWKRSFKARSASVTKSALPCVASCRESGKLADLVDRCTGEKLDKLLDLLQA